MFFLLFLVTETVNLLENYLDVILKVYSIFLLEVIKLYIKQFFLRKFKKHYSKMKKIPFKHSNTSLFGFVNQFDLLLFNCIVLNRSLDKNTSNW